MSVGLLAGIVLIRTFLSFSLETEIEVAMATRRKRCCTWRKRSTVSSDTNVRFWHLADVPLTPANVRFRGQWPTPVCNLAKKLAISNSRAYINVIIGFRPEAAGG
jgi:hypothetical protein